MFLRFADAWDEEDEDEHEEEREEVEVAATGYGLNSRQRDQNDLLHWVQNNMKVQCQVDCYLMKMIKL